jgi:ribosome-associated translation inhibitor RaiA
MSTILDHEITGGETMSTSEQCEIQVNFREDIPGTDGMRQFIEERCTSTSQLFPELVKIEVSLVHDGDGFTAHAHATGRKTNLAVTHDWSRDPGGAVNDVLARLESKLRRHHEKLWPKNHGRKGSKHHFDESE